MEREISRERSSSKRISSSRRSFFRNDIVDVSPTTELYRELFPSPRLSPVGERTVKRLRLSKALTAPDTTSVGEACRRMAANRVDALLLTDSNALLCGILTVKDIALRAVARELPLESTPVSKIMTRNPAFVFSNTIAIEALQKMVQGKVTHLPVVENGEVVALLDIAKCLYDAIARLERAAEKGKAIAAAVEGVSGSTTLIEALREKMFKPSLSTILNESLRPVKVSPSETVLEAARKMAEMKSSGCVVVVDNKAVGILTSTDILMRVVAKNLPPFSTLVETVMTKNPDCASVDTAIVDALHTMNKGKFHHLPVIDQNGNAVSIVDVIHVTHAAVATVSQVGINPNAVDNSMMMQKFFDSAMRFASDEDADNPSDISVKYQSDGTEIGRSFHYPVSANMYSFKIQDRKGRMIRFNCGTQSLTDLITAIVARLGDDVEHYNLHHILYQDEDRDKVVLETDNDLSTAVDHARSAGLKSLRLYIDCVDTGGRKKFSSYAHPDTWTSALVSAGAALAAGLGVFSFMRK